MFHLYIHECIYIPVPVHEQQGRVVFYVSPCTLIPPSTVAIVRDHNGQFRKIMKLPSGTDRHDRRTRRQQQGRPVREQFKLKQIRGQFHPQLGTPGAPPTHPILKLIRPFHFFLLV